MNTNTVKCFDKPCIFYVSRINVHLDLLLRFPQTRVVLNCWLELHQNRPVTSERLNVHACFTLLIDLIHPTVFWKCTFGRTDANDFVDSTLFGWQRQPSFCTAGPQSSKGDVTLTVKSFLCLSKTAYARRICALEISERKVKIKTDRELLFCITDLFLTPCFLCKC